MLKRLYTEACIRDMRPGTSLRLGSEAMATPAAIDLAFLRGIQIQYGDAPSPRQTAGVLDGLLENDGTYVVEVRGGVPTVHRLTEAGPQPVELKGS